MTICMKDSGNRTVFSTGAVRDVQAGKGRCDLLPLTEIHSWLNDAVILYIREFKCTGDAAFLISALNQFAEGKNKYELVLDVSKHFEHGAEKYGLDNWKKGLPISSYINSGIRHYLKHMAGYTDEIHSRAFVWNMLAALWTMRRKPELDDFTRRENSMSFSLAEQPARECEGAGVCTYGEWQEEAAEETTGRMFSPVSGPMQAALKNAAKEWYNAPCRADGPPKEWYCFACATIDDECEACQFDAHCHKPTRFSPKPWCDISSCGDTEGKR